MFMKVTLVAVVTALSLTSGIALAGEGAGDPFPFRAPGVVTYTTGRAVLPNAATDPYPFKAEGTVMTPSMSQQVLPTNGSQGAVQSVNSLPVGFENGTGASAHRASVQQYFQAQAARQAAVRVIAQHRSGGAANNG